MRARFVLLPCLLLAASAPAVADENLVSRTVLDAAQEVQDAPVVSDGTAAAVIRFDPAFTRATVRVAFARLEGRFTRLHIHCQLPGDNGPIAIGLIDFVAPDFDNSDVVSLAGNVVTGTLTNAQFPETDGCPDVVGRPVNNIVALAAAADAGLLYWNLHTDAFPAGELRGQLRPLEAQDD